MIVIYRSELTGKIFPGKLLVSKIFFKTWFQQISKQEGHEFYELVNAYYRARNALAIARQEFEVLNLSILKILFFGYVPGKKCHHNIVYISVVTICDVDCEVALVLHTAFLC